MVQRTLVAYAILVASLTAPPRVVQARNLETAFSTGIPLHPGAADSLLRHQQDPRSVRLDTKHFDRALSVAKYLGEVPMSERARTLASRPGYRVRSLQSQPVVTVQTRDADRALHWLCAGALEGAKVGRVLKVPLDGYRGPRQGLIREVWIQVPPAAGSQGKPVEFVAPKSFSLHQLRGVEGLEALGEVREAWSLPSAVARLSEVSSMIVVRPD